MVRTVADIIYLTKYKNTPGLLMNIDFEKAYDSIDHEFLKKVMKSFNFRESIQRWVCTFYNNIQSCVMNNGMSSGYFDEPWSETRRSTYYSWLRWRSC